MDIIQLQDKQEGWRIHRFNSLEERNAAFAEHNITIGSGVNFAPYVMLGDHTVLGDNVYLSEESVVSHHCQIGDNTLVDKGAFISMRAKVGNECNLAPDSYVGPDANIGNMVSIGESAEIGEKVQLGNSVTVGKGSYVMDESQLQDGCTVGRGCFIGNKSVGGFFVMIGDDSQLVREVFVQEGTRIAAGSRIPAFAKVTRSSVQIEENRLEKAMAQMGKNIKYDQIATFTSLEGVRCVRAQVGGIWMPSVRVDSLDSRAFGRGEMSLKDMADKYIAPTYIQQSFEAESRGQGMRR